MLLLLKTAVADVLYGRMNKYLVFIAAGGRGKRLIKALPEFEKTGLPKSLGLVVGGKPIMSYQLEQFLQHLDNPNIVISFNDRKSIESFNRYITEGKVPRYNYNLNLGEYGAGHTTIDIIRSSHPNTPWRNDFEVIIISSGDVYFDSSHLPKMLKICNERHCSIQTLYNFKKYMVSLPSHFHPIYNADGKLEHIKESQELPNEIICHPQFLTHSAFSIYSQMPMGTSKSEFVNKAITEGEEFRVVKPLKYVNLNFPQDYGLLSGYFAQNKV